MKTVFRGEFFRLSRSAVLLLAIAVLLVCDLFISSRSKVTESNLYDLAELPGAGTFVNFFQDSKTSPDGAAARMRLPRVKNQPETAVLQDEPGTKYENLIEVYWACSPYYFRWVLASNQGLMVIPLIFAVMFLARDFPNRVFNDSLYIGKRRREVFWGKTLFYFLLAFLVSLAGILLLTLVYASAAFRILPGGYVWSRILLLQEFMTAEEEEEEGEETEYDEHVWTSPVNAIAITEAVRDALKEADPENAAAYTANAEAYIQKLRELDISLRELVKNAKRQLLVFGDRFPFLYFVREYGLSYAAAFPGCSSGTDVNPATVAHLIDLVKAEGIPVVFRCDLSAGKIADTIAESTGARVLTLWSGHTVSRDAFQAGETYLTLWAKNLEALKEALY